MAGLLHGERAVQSGGVAWCAGAARTGTPGTTEGAWADNGTIVVSSNFRVNVLRRPLTRLSSQGATAEIVSRPGPSESHHDPHVLPGSTTVLFTLATPQSFAIAAVPLAGGPHRVILADARRPRYSASGHLLFQRPSSGDLMSIAFDPSRLETSGEPTHIAPLRSSSTASPLTWHRTARSSTARRPIRPSNRGSRSSPSIDRAPRRRCWRRRVRGRSPGSRRTAVRSCCGTSFRPTAICGRSIWRVAHGPA